MNIEQSTKRICFLGKGGIGKSVIISNISEALAKMGKRVLQIGNDISLCSTLVLRGEEEVKPVLASYRSQFNIHLNDFIIESKHGVLLMELGSIEPGAGCLARGIHYIDELLSIQGIIEKYQIDYILYDIAGETPCTGFILPIRDGLMDKCFVITTGEFSSLSTANNLLAGILKSNKGTVDVGMIVNYADEYQTKALLTDYVKKVKVPILAFIETSHTIRNSYLETKSVYEAYPESIIIKIIDQIAEDMIHFEYKEEIAPFTQHELLVWQKDWKKKAYQYNNGIIDVDYSQNI